MKINSVPVCYTHCPKPALVGWWYDAVQWGEYAPTFRMNRLHWWLKQPSVLKRQDEPSRRHAPNYRPYTARTWLRLCRWKSSLFWKPMNRLRFENRVTLLYSYPFWSLLCIELIKWKQNGKFRCVGLLTALYLRTCWWNFYYIWH